MKKGYGRKIEWIVVAVIILSCGGILWLPYMGAEVKPWEQGRNVPRTPPAEDRRVYDLHHFSFVAPLNWDWRVTPSEAGSTILKYPRMTLWPKRSFGGRRAFIYIEGPVHIEGPVDMSTAYPDWRETTFQDSPAFFRVETRPGTFDDPPQFKYSMWFQNSGDSYNLTYVGLLHQEELPPMIQRYFDTFRVETPTQKEDGR